MQHAYMLMLLSPRVTITEHTYLPRGAYPKAAVQGKLNMTVTWLEPRLG